MVKSTIPSRTEFSDDELRQLIISPWKIKRAHLTDDEKSRLHEIEQKRFRELGRLLADVKVEEQPIVAELTQEGVSVDSVWDLVKRSAPYPEAIPVLIKYLPTTKSDRLMEGIARSLAVPEARSAWPLLVAQYRRTREGYEGEFLTGAKGGLAAALQVTATEAVLDELVELVRDRSNGESRFLLLWAFRRFKSEAAKQALTDLATDPELAAQIALLPKSKSRKPRV